MIRLLDDPDATLRQLMTRIKGPDFPTGGEIVSTRDDREDLQDGQRHTALARPLPDRGRRDRHHELPYQASGARVLEQIAGQMTAKKLPMVEDLRDESDHENPTRLVLTPARRVDVEALMKHLFATTDLERTMRVNVNVIGLDGRPTVTA